MNEAERMALLDELVRGHQARLRAFLYSRTGDIDAADDLAQEVFLAAFRKIERFDRRRPAWPWLAGFARNELREHWRAVARDKVGDALEALVSRSLPEAEEPPLDALSRCLDKLPAASRELVRWIYTDRINCAEAARRLKQSAVSVRVALHRIRRALFDCVKGQLA